MTLRVLKKYNGYEIQSSDVGKHIDEYLNLVCPKDVGRKLYFFNGLWYLESMKQATKKKLKEG